jgi:superfamily I DNA/RNA helicase
VGFSDIAVLYRTDAQSGVVLDELTRYGLPVQKRSHDRLSERPGVAHIMRELAHVSPAQHGSVGQRVRAAAAAVLATLPDDQDQTAEIHAAAELLGPLAQRCGDDVERFHRELLLGAEVDTWDPRAQAISLLTLHAAKGLEFPVVFVVGCEDGLMPLRWPGTEPDDAAVAEERRLFFVGMTRAQDHLFLTHAAKRTRHARMQDTKPSPFLADLGNVATETVGAAQPRRAKQLTLL